MKAVVLAAGEGRRLEPLTNRRPKPMLSIAGKPLLEYVVDAVEDAGIDEVVLVVGYARDRIQTYFGDGDDWDVDIEYAVQEKQLGTGHAVLQAEPFVDGEFVALNGDRIVEPSAISSVVEERRDGDGPVMAITRAETPENYGVVELDGRRVVSIAEKPPTHAVTTEFINAGVYGLDDSVFDGLRAAESEGELAITTTIQKLDEPLSAVPFDGLWLDVSHLWDLLSVNAHAIDRFGARWDPSADGEGTVVEPVAVGSDVRIRPGATVLPGTSLGDNVEVGANAVVSNAVVLPDASIGDGAVVRDCIVGENADIGPNTTIEGGDADVVVDETFYGDVRLGGVVGDNATVGGGVTFAPGTVLGNDATVETGVVVDGRIENDVDVRRG